MPPNMGAKYLQSCGRVSHGTGGGSGAGERGREREATHPFGMIVLGAGLHDDLEVGVAEGDLADVPLLGLRFVRDLFEVDDE